MSHDPRLSFAWPRRLALAAIIVLGVVAIIGSGSGGGGGGGGAECSFFSNTCNPVIPPTPSPPAASVTPVKLTVVAGTSVAFTVQASGVANPVLQWRRSVDGGLNFIDVPGASGGVLTVAAAQLADDGAIFPVDVRASGSNAILATSNTGTLLVSSMPAIVFADGDFDPADWSASALADPPLNGPTHSEDRRATGGLPDAYRHMVHTLTAGPSSLHVFNVKASATWDPQVLGAIHAIDYAEDCDRLSASATSLDVLSYPLIEQAGRRYVSRNGRGCLSLWLRFNPLPSLAISDFVQVDGPACGPGATCPDFSAGGAPLRFGFARRASLPTG
jgi:predicted secreted protein